MKSKITIFFFAFLCLITLSNEGFGAEKAVNFFYSKTCPHCHKEFQFLKELQTKHPEVKINYINIHENYNLYKEFAKKYQTKASGVPRTFIGDKVFIGFTNATGELTYVDAYEGYYGYRNQIEKHILDLFNIGGGISSVKMRAAPIWIFGLIPLYLLSILLLRKKLKISWTIRHWWVGGLIAVIVFSIFSFVLLTPDAEIKTFASSFPFPVFTTIIALADGFNPCAFTVLIILLSLLTYTEERKSMGIIGITFVITSALMYFVFILVMIFFGHWAMDRYGPTIMLILGIIVLIAGLINLKDYFFFKKGISLTISEKHRLKISRHASKITKMVREAETWHSILIAIFATFLLAVFVNLVELGCTAIFPAVYTVSLLQTYPDSISLQIFWTAFYAIIYIIPLLVILIDFIYTFKSSRMSERQVKILKLVSGIFMLIFGILMIFKPEILMFA